MSEETKERCVRIGGLVQCREETCDAMFAGLPEGFKETFDKTVLPCGHQIATIMFSGSSIKRAARAEELLEWFHNNGMILSEAKNAVSIAGGSFEDVRGEITVPKRDLTDEEHEDILLHADIRRA